MRPFVSSFVCLSGPNLSGALCLHIRSLSLVSHKSISGLS